MTNQIVTGYETCRCGATITLSLISTVELAKMLRTFREAHEVCRQIEKERGHRG